MSVYSKILELINGASRTVDLSTNTLSLGAQQLNGATSGSLTQSANATTTTYSIVWPAAQAASSGYALFNDGAGNLTWAAASSGANTALSNLSAVAINTSLLPGVDNSISLGSASFSWLSAYIHTLKDASNVISIDSYNRLLEDSGANVSVDYGNRTLKDSSNAIQLSWSTSGVEINSAALNMNSNKISNLADGTVATDAATYGQLLSTAAGLSFKNAVVVATAAALPAYTWASGVGGADTLTGNSTGTLTVDGVLTALGNRILVKNETGTPNDAYNGIYTVTTAGAVGVAYVLTRATDMQSWTQVPGTVLVAQSGTVNADSGFICTAAPGGTLDSTAITFSEFGYFLADGTTLTLTGNTFAVKNAGITETQIASSTFSTTGALSGGSGTKVSVNVDNSTIDINGSNQLEVKSAGITSTQLASASVTTAKLGTITDGVTLDQSGSGSTLEIKSGGVGTTQLASASVTAAKLGSVTDGITTDQNGSGSTIEVLNSPSIKRILVAGQSFSANTSYAVRWGLTANSETSTRIYAADITTSSFDLMYVIGMASSGTSVSAGQNITVTGLGSFALSSSDSAFGSNTDGAPVFLAASGGFSTTAPSSSGQAVTRIGIVQTRSATATLNIIDVAPAVVGVN